MSTHHESNVDEVYGWLDRSVSGFSLHDSEAGINMIEKVVTGIQLRSMADQCTWAGEAWPENDPDYLEYKKRHYDSGLINYRTGQMLSQTSLLGENHIDRKSIEMRYGTGQVPDSSMNGYMEPSDLETTDREKAEIAVLAGRSFFDLDDDIRNQVFEVFSEAFGEHLKQIK